LGKSKHNEANVSRAKRGYPRPRTLLCDYSLLRRVVKVREETFQSPPDGGFGGKQPKKKKIPRGG